MLAVLSPAKSLDFDAAPITKKASQPQFVAESTQLIKGLRKLSPQDLSNLMGISDKLAELNNRRYAEWQPEFAMSLPATKQAVLAFRGDVYLGLEAENFSERDFTWAQKRIRILSGLHGVLRPLDLIHPYRLEMGTKLANPKGADLYQFWGSKVTDTLNDDLAALARPVLLNLASNEYFAVLQRDRLAARIIDFQFLDYKNGKYKFLSFFAKKARGLMAAYMVANRITTPKALQQFDWHGYQYCEERSSADHFVFIRDQVTDYRG